MEKRCQCLTSKGTRCLNNRSTKGTKQQFCWMHQNCQKVAVVNNQKNLSVASKKKIVIKKPMIKKQLIKKPIFDSTIKWNRKQYNGLYPYDLFDHLNIDFLKLYKDNYGTDNYNFDGATIKGHYLTENELNEIIFAQKTITFVFPKLIDDYLDENSFDHEKVIGNTLRHFLMTIIDWTLDLAEEINGGFEKLNINNYYGIDQLNNSSNSEIIYTLGLFEPKEADEEID